MVAFYLQTPKKILKVLVPYLFIYKLVTSFTVDAQVIDCENYFKNFVSDEPTELVHVFESQPIPVGGLEAFYKSIKKKTDTSKEKGKVS